MDCSQQCDQYTDAALARLASLTAEISTIRRLKLQQKGITALNHQSSVGDRTAATRSTTESVASARARLTALGAQLQAAEEAKREKGSLAQSAKTTTSTKPSVGRIGSSERAAAHSHLKQLQEDCAVHELTMAMVMEAKAAERDGLEAQLNTLQQQRMALECKVRAADGGTIEEGDDAAEEERYQLTLAAIETAKLRMGRVKDVIATIDMYTAMANNEAVVLKAKGRGQEALIASQRQQIALLQYEARRAHLAKKGGGITAIV